MTLGFRCKAFFVLLIFSLSAFPQNRKLDSLRKVIASSPPDSILADTYLSIGLLYDKNQNDSMAWYSQKSIDIVSQALTKATEKSKRSYLVLLAASYNNLATAKYYAGDMGLCIDYFEKSLKVRKELNDKKELATSYSNLAVVYADQGQVSKALEYYFHSLKLHQENKNIYGEGLVLNNIASLYSTQKELDKSLDYYNKSLSKWTESGNKSGVALVQNSIGNIYLKKGDTAIALKGYQDGLKISREIDDQSGIANALHNIGNLYYKSHRYQNALEFHKNSLDIRTKLNEKAKSATSLTALANDYLQLGDLNEALKYGKEALVRSQELGFPSNIQYSAEALMLVYKKKKDWQNAFLMKELYTRMHDSVINDANTKKTMKSELNFEFRRAAIADSIKNAEQIKIADAEISFQKSQRNYLIGGLALIVVFALLLVNRFKLIQRQKKEIENQNLAMHEKNNELERLSIVASETENVILILDDKGELEWVNESFVRLNGITMTDLKKLKGNTIFEISNNPEIRNIINRTVEQKAPVTYESLNITQDGKKVWESSTLTPIFDDSGKLRKLIIIDTDVTARKEAEEIIKEKNKDITDSINYARRIQYSLLAQDELLRKQLKEYFVLFKPKDIVSGDFYWAAKKNEKFYLAVCDSTGHGVPGAFMSLLNMGFLSEAINEKGIERPDEVLDYIRQRLISSISREGQKDGFDGILLCVENDKITYAAAHNAPVLVYNSEMLQLNADKMPVGKGEKEDKFALYQIEAKKGSMIYLFTDGYPDQFGGPKGKKFKYRQLEELLLEIHQDPLEKQREKLLLKFENWKGQLEQVDDVCIVGIKF